jgi:predicted AAA+ superfamily ATPase
LGGSTDLKKFKVLPFDHALYQRLMGITPSELLTSGTHELTNKGALAEVFCGTELIGYSSYGSPAELFYWHREARSSNAEVDYVVQIDSTIVPIEVKAGARGGMKSLRVFLSEKKNVRGARISLDRLALVDGVIILPLYAISQLGRLTQHYGPAKGG